MRRLIYSIFVGIFATVPTLLAQSQTLDIDQSIEIALKHSPDIDIGRFDFESSIERAKFQRGLYLPRLDLSATAAKTEMEYEDQSTLRGSSLIGDLSASQLIYDFGKTGGQISSANEISKAYKATMNQIISQKILSIKTLYYDVLKMRSTIEVNKKNITLQEAQLRRAERYYESGIRTIVDVSDAKVRLTQAKLDLSNSKYELKMRRAKLEEAMGQVPYNGAYKLYHKSFNPVGASSRLPKIDTPLSNLESFAYDHRYELQSSKHLANSADDLVQSKRGDYLPELSLGGNYQQQRVDQEFAGVTPQKQWQAGINLKWNLFAGGQSDAALQEAKIESMKSVSQVEAMRLLIKRQVIEARLNVMRTKDSVVLSQSILGASETKFLQVKKQYKNDLSDYIELQEAQQSYIEALGDLVVVYYDYYIAIANLDYAVGR